MSSDNKNNQIFTQEFLSRFLNYAAAFVILTVVVCFIIISSYRFCSVKESNDVVKVNKIEFVHVPKITDSNSIAISKKLLDEIKASNDTLTQNISKLNVLKEEIRKINSENKEDFKFYIAILGAIIAIVGFFGFKSIHDTRESSIKFASDEAKLIAKSIATSEAKDEIKIQNQLKDTRIDTLEGNYEELASRLDAISQLELAIEDLKIRLNELENLDEVNENIIKEDEIDKPDPTNNDDADIEPGEDPFADK